jgi:hypothetical protein
MKFHADQGLMLSVLLMSITKILPIHMHLGTRHLLPISTLCVARRLQTMPSCLQFGISGLVVQGDWEASDGSYPANHIRHEITQSSCAAHTRRSSITRVLSTSRGVVSAAATPPAILPHTAASCGGKDFMPEASAHFTFNNS